MFVTQAPLFFTGPPRTTWRPRPPWTRRPPVRLVLTFFPGHLDGGFMAPGARDIVVELSVGSLSKSKAKARTRRALPTASSGALRLAIAPWESHTAPEPLRLDIAP